MSTKFKDGDRAKIAKWIGEVNGDAQDPDDPLAPGTVGTVYVYAAAENEGEEDKLVFKDDAGSWQHPLPALLGGWPVFPSELEPITED